MAEAIRRAPVRACGPSGAREPVQPPLAKRLEELRQEVLQAARGRGAAWPHSTIDRLVGSPSMPSCQHIEAPFVALDGQALHAFRQLAVMALAVSVPVALACQRRASVVIEARAVGPPCTSGIPSVRLTPRNISSSARGWRAGAEASMPAAENLQSPWRQPGRRSLGGAR